MKWYALVLVMLAFTSYAKDSPAERFGKFRIDVITEPKSYRYDDISIRMVASFYIKWKMWILLGEPVIYSEGRWALEEIRVKKDNWEEVTWFPCEKRSAGRCLPENVWKKIKVITAKARTCPFGRYGICMTLDPGVFAEPLSDKSIRRRFLDPYSEGQASFNMPGSPDWGKVFYNYLEDAKRSLAISAKDAKAFFYDPNMKVHYGLKGDFTDIEVDFSSVLSYFLEQEKKVAQEKAMNDVKIKRDAQLKKIERSTNDDIFADFESELVEKEFQTETREEQQQVSTDFTDDYKRLETISNQAKSRIKERRREISSRYMPSENLERFYQNGLYGYRTDSGKVVINPKYPDAGDYSEGLAPVQLPGDSMWGYINAKGDLVLAAKYNWAGSFDSGKAVVKVKLKSKLYEVNGTCGVSVKDKQTWGEYKIDKDGNRISEVKKEIRRRHVSGHVICLRASD